MRTDFYYQSGTGVRLHGCKWTPEGEVCAVVQIVHGIAEHVERYDAFARFLNERGVLVVAEDHMGHGQSVVKGELGYFRQGWTAAVEDTFQLLQDTKTAFPEVPYFLLGHSMGSFMARSLLILHPDCGLAGCILSGTGWQPEAVLHTGLGLCRAKARVKGDKYHSAALNNMIFGNYNAKVEHRRTAFDWLTRDDQIVDAYIADPLCGFVPSVGLLGNVMEGMLFDQKQSNLSQMNKQLPVFFVAGEADPVGNYGKGVRRCKDAFREAGLKNISLKLYPLCRHEILNEWNCNQIFEEIYDWIRETC